MRRTISLVVLAFALVSTASSAQAEPADGDLTRTVAEVERGLLASVSEKVAFSTDGQGAVAHDVLELDVIDAINAERADAGVRPVVVWSKLAKSADYHTREMIRGDYFAHGSLNGWTFQQRLRKLADAGTAGEVIAYSILDEEADVTAGAVMDIWNGSGRHRSKILTRAYNRVGVSRRIGRFKDSTAAVITVDFARVR